jgi:hypothetical protein
MYRTENPADTFQLFLPPAPLLPSHAGLIMFNSSLRLISLKRGEKMIRHELNQDEGILIVIPEAPLESADFEKLASEVDPFIEKTGKLHGLLIHAESFPGWKNFGGLVSHLKFIKNHHREIEKIAAVTDSGFLSIMPRITNHFVKAEVRHFNFNDKGKALEWLKQDVP